MRFLKIALVVFLLLVLLPIGGLAYLYLSDPVVASRYVGMFTLEDGDYAILTPRMPVTGEAPRNIPTSPEDDLTIHADALAEMIEFAIKHRSYSLIVIHKGVIQTEWYADGWHRDRLTQSQSMHKSVLPLLVQSAIQDGLIASIDDPIGLYIEEWRDDPRGEITIKNLMVMSSGLRSPPFSLNPFADDYQWLFGTDITPVLLRTPLEWQPGKKWEYNNIASELLGLIIERTTQQPYANYLAEKIWKPMGGAGAEVWLDAENGKAHSNCCLLTTTLDWARFGLMLLDRGRVAGKQVVNSKFIDEMISPAPTSTWYGYQIWLADPTGGNPWLGLSRGYQRSEAFLRDDAYYTSGFGAQRVYVVPSEDLVITRMGPARGEDFVSPVRQDWDNAFLVNTALRNLVD